MNHGIPTYRYHEPINSIIPILTPPFGLICFILSFFIGPFSSSIAIFMDKNRKFGKLWYVIASQTIWIPFLGMGWIYSIIYCYVIWKTSLTGLEYKRINDYFGFRTDNWFLTFFVFCTF